MAQANFGKAIKNLHKQDGISDNAKAYLMSVHEKAKEARHEWSSGEPYLLNGTNTLYNNNAISENTMKYLVDVNKAYQKAQHKW